MFSHSSFGSQPYVKVSFDKIERPDKDIFSLDQVEEATQNGEYEVWDFPVIHDPSFIGSTIKEVPAIEYTSYLNLSPNFYSFAAELRGEMCAREAGRFLSSARDLGLLIEKDGIYRIDPSSITWEQEYDYKRLVEVAHENNFIVAL